MQALTSGSSVELDVQHDSIQLEIFDKVPPWAIAHAARDNSTAPLILEGDVAVVKCDGCAGYYPKDGGLYLIEYVCKAHGHFGLERRTREIIQAAKRKGGWYALPYARTYRGKKVFVAADGPYADEIVMSEKILGPVIGIYRPRAI